jgi:hypothetical protein
VLAITSLLLVLTFSLLITRVATVILTATGMSRTAARFQARSAFTGAGFTTSESEQVVDHPMRRKVIANLMLLGNAGIVAAASSAILGFRGGVTGGQWWRLLELVGGLLALLFFSRSPAVDRRLTAAISHLLHRYTDVPIRDLAGVLELSGEYAVSELAIEKGDWVAGRALRDLELRDEGIAVLGITRGDGRYVGAPIGASVIRPGDVLVVYGREEPLRELDRRAAGPGGDRAHQEAVRRQGELERNEHAADEAHPSDAA